MMPESSIFFRLRWPPSPSFSTSSESNSGEIGCCRLNVSRHFSADHSSDMKFLRKRQTTMLSLEKDKNEGGFSPLVKWSDIDPELESEVLKTHEKYENTETKVPITKKQRRKRLSRCLSASSSSTASTNTEPDDFNYATLIYEGCVTLPRRSSNSKDGFLPKIITPTNFITVSRDNDCQCLDIPFIDHIHTCESKETNKNGDKILNQPHRIKRGSKDDMFGVVRCRAFRDNRNGISAKIESSLCPPIQEEDEIVAEETVIEEKFFSIDEQEEFVNTAEKEYLSTVRDECLPDILKNCHFGDQHSSKSSLSISDVLEKENIGVKKESNTEINCSGKKSVKFLLPPEYCEVDFFHEVDDSFSK